MIDQRIICWINEFTVQHHYTVNMVGTLTWARAEYCEKRLSSAQRRYLRVCETLARARKRAQVAPLQRNSGTQPINVGGGTPPPAVPPALVVDAAQAPLRSE